MSNNKSNEVIKNTVHDEEGIEINGSETKSRKNKRLLKIQSTQAFMPIRDIKDGIIITKDRRYIKIMEITPINFL